MKLFLENNMDYQFNFNEIVVYNKVIPNNNNYNGKMIKVSNVANVSPQNVIVENLVHYRHTIANPGKFIKRKFNYRQMKVINEKFRKVSERLKTFTKFPKSLSHLVKPLAMSGFYFIGNEGQPDKVQCIFCQGILAGWKKSDIPNVEHKKHFATCPFLLNFDVGNENIKFEEDYSQEDCKQDPDLVRINGEIPYVIVTPNVDIISLDNIDMFDIDSRLETFRNHQYLKDYSFNGLFIDVIDKKNFLKCCECQKSMELLQHIERLPLTIFHTSNCKFYNSNYSQNQTDFSEDFPNTKRKCEIEFSITDSEIESRLDLIKINQIENLNLDRDKIKTCIASKLKRTGTDYESTYELIHDLRNFKEIPNQKIEIEFSEFILSEFSCVVCLDKPVEVIFLPCGHWKTCQSCSSLLKNCPVCRSYIVKRVRGVDFRNNDF